MAKMQRNGKMHHATEQSFTWRTFLLVLLLFIILLLVLLLFIILLLVLLLFILLLSVLLLFIILLLVLLLIIPIPHSSLGIPHFLPFPVSTHPIIIFHSPLPPPHSPFPIPPPVHSHFVLLLFFLLLLLHLQNLNNYQNQKR